MDRRALWAGSIVLASSVSFAAGIAYGIPLVSVESHYDLDRLVHRLFWEMRESDIYLTHNNYGLLMSADWDGDGIVMFPNNAVDGSSSGKGWSPESVVYTNDYPNGTRLYKMVDPEGNVLRDIAFHHQRDKVVMMAIIDYKKDYLTADEQDRIAREFYPDHSPSSLGWP